MVRAFVDSAGPVGRDRQRLGNDARVRGAQAGGARASPARDMTRLAGAALRQGGIGAATLAKLTAVGTVDGSVVEPPQASGQKGQLEPCPGAGSAGGSPVPAAFEWWSGAQMTAGKAASGAATTTPASMACSARP
jgi:hypothetical protein